LLKKLQIRLTMETKIDVRANWCRFSLSIHQ
jgi:hypothetical protein